VLVPPSPKSQAHKVGEFIDVSVNWTASGAVPVDGEQLNPATGSTTAALVVVVMGEVVTAIVVATIVGAVVATVVGTLVATVVAGMVIIVVGTAVGVTVIVVLSAAAGRTRTVTKTRAINSIKNVDSRIRHLSIGYLAPTVFVA
jgi:hypothetical protein